MLDYNDSCFLFKLKDELCKVKYLFRKA